MKKRVIKMLITKYVIECVFCVLLIVLSYNFMVNGNALKSSNDIIKNNSILRENSLTFLELNDYNDDFLKSAGNIISRNTNSVETNNKLYLCINKKIIDPDCLTIFVNKNILTKENIIVDDDYYRYMIDNSSYSSYSDKNFYIELYYTGKEESFSYFFQSQLI